MSTKFPYMIQDSKSLLCWTALNTAQPGSTFALSTCIQSFPPPNNQRFVDLAQWWSGGPNGTKVPNPVLPILDFSADPSNSAQWASTSLCLGLTNTGILVTVNCGDGSTSGALGWSNTASNILNGTCLGPNSNGLIAMQSSCTTTPSARFYKPWSFPINAVPSSTTTITTTTTTTTTSTGITTTTTTKAATTTTCRRRRC
jgi:hypothetical protein